MDYKYSYGRKNEPELTLGAKICLGLLAVVICIIPLIMRLKEYDNNLSQYAWFSTSDKSLDIFLAVKSDVLVVVAGIMFVVILFKIFMDREKFRLTPWMIALIGYAGFTIVSTVVSPYRNFGMTGIFEQFESLWVLIAYCVLLVYAYLFVQDRASVSFVKKALAFLAVVHSFIGISQLIGKDFWTSELGRLIMVPSSIPGAEEIRSGLEFTFSNSGNHQVYLTLYNPNYVGSYAALLFPVFVVVAIFSNAIWKKAFWGVIAVINFLCAMGSGSKTFLGAFAVSAVLSVILFRKKLKKGWPVFVGFGAVLVISTAVYFNYVGVNVVQYVKNAIAIQENDSKLENVTLGKDGAEITYNGVKFNFSYDSVDGGAYFNITDENGVTLPYKYLEDGYSIVIDDERLTEVTFQYLQLSEGSDAYLVNVTVPKGSFAFIKTDGGYKYYTGNGKVDDIYYAPSAVIKNHDALASGRGYIWSRTFPVLFNHLILGSGADSFTPVFPQNDYIGKLNGGFNNLLITKPHNLYLQVGVQSGGIALLCFIAVAAIYLIQTIRLCFKRELNTEMETFAVAIALGITGYLATGMFNDSCVALAPLYWILLGVGFGVNAYIEKADNRKV